MHSFIYLCFGHIVMIVGNGIKIDSLLFLKTVWSDKRLSVAASAEVGLNLKLYKSICNNMLNVNLEIFTLHFEFQNHFYFNGCLF